MKPLLFAAICVLSLAVDSFAQTAESFDISMFQPPKGWTKQAGQAYEFSAYFEAVKGGRILHPIRGSIEDLHLYKVR